MTGRLVSFQGVRSSGSSSLLWSFLLAANWKFLPGIGPVLYSGLLNATLLVAIGIGMLAMARRDGLPESTCWIWALTPALDGNFMWLGAVGMEHVLFTALSVVGVYLWFERGLRSALGCAACLGALSLTRPEGLVLTVVALGAAQWAGRKRRDTILLASFVAFCVCLSFAANFVTSHSWLPTTYAGRKWLYFGTEHITLMERLLFIVSMGENILHAWFVTQTHALYLLSAVVLLLMAVGAWGLVAGRSRRTSFLLLWSVIHVCIYAVMLPSRSHGGRYQPLFLAMSFPLMFLGVERLLRKGFRPLSPGQKRFGAFLTVTVGLVCGALSLRVWRQVTADGVAVIESCHGRMGMFLLNSLPAQSKVAAFDIGRMGYLYGGHLVDLGGLTDSSFLPYLRAHHLMRYLTERQIPYFVWPSQPDGSSAVPQIFIFTDDDQRQLTKMTTFCAPSEAWQVSYDATVLAAPCQTLYALKK